MKISDYEFLSNIDALFEKRIIIYGAGVDGRRMYQILSEIPIRVECFCDRNPMAQHALPVPVISIDALKEKTQKDDDCFVIIGSSDYFEEIIADLDKKQISAYVCTWQAVRIGIELNIEDKRFNESFRNDFIQRKHLWNQNALLCNDVVPRMTINLYPNTILVYQAKKVGSRTVQEALEQEHISSVHVHYLMKHVGIPAIDDSTEYLCKKVQKDGIKIISLVREPIARGISYFMQRLTRDFIWFDRGKSPDIEAEASKWVTDLLEQNEEFVWFDREIKELTGVDVYAYPFDQDQGYAWIKEGKTEILLLKLEMLNQNVDKIGEFVGCPGIELIEQNVGSKKISKYIYQQLKKNFRVSASAVRKQYENNAKFDHFYSEQEKRVFLEKWQDHIIEDEI